MKRVIIVFVGLVVLLSVALGLKVRENQAALERPTGGSGVVEGTEVDITARLPARVLTVEAAEGDAVKAGQVLVRLECSEQDAVLEAARARLRVVEQQAEAAKAQARAALGAASAADAQVGAAGAQKQALASTRDVTARQVARVEKLQGKGGATEMELDRVSTQADQLAEQLRALDGQLNAARGQASAAKGQAEAARAQAEAASIAIAAATADVKRAVALQAECTLSSPIDGFVLTRALEPGEVVMPGSRVLTVVRLDEVETTFYVPNAELSRVAPGRAVNVVADAYAGETFPGKVLSVSAKAEFTPRNVQTREDRDRLVYAVRALIPNADGRLRPGMPVEVTVDEQP